MAGAFLQGYRDQGNADRQGALSSMQRVSGVLSLKQSLDEQASNEALKGALAASGGDLTKAMQATIQSGNLPAAAKLAPLLKLQQESDMAKRLAGIDVSNMTPEKATAAGMQFSAAGHPLGPAFMTLANQLRTQDAAVAEHRGQVSTPAPITATPQMGINPMGVLAERSQIPTDTISGNPTQPIPFESVPPEVQEAMRSGGRFSIGVGPSTNPAENTQRVGGLFSPLYTSQNPAIQAQAAMEQLTTDRSNPRVVSPTSRIAAFDRLAAANTASANATAMKQMGIDSRQPQRVTTTTIADPNDPTGQRGLVIDANTREVIGVSPKLTQTGTIDVKLQQQLPQARRVVALVTQNMDRLDTALAELDKDPGLSNITGSIAGRTPNITNLATGAQAKLKSIKSQIFQSSLQAMREASKTGGAVGNVSDKEGDKLENTIAALDQAQSTKDFRAQIAKAREQVKLSKQIINQAYQDQFGNVQPYSPGQGGSSGTWKDL